MENSRAQRRDIQADKSGRLFVVAFSARIVVVIVMCLATTGSIGSVSRDSAKYHNVGREIAKEYARGEIEWAEWFDDGWYQFVGLVYFVFGVHIEIVMAINALLAAGATVLLYRIAREVFSDEPVARMSAYLFALFPSVVFYTSLPLKEAASLFGLLGVVWGVVCFIQGRQDRGLLWMAAGLAILAGLRAYMCFVCLGCVVVCVIPFRIARGWGGVFQVACILLASAIGAYFVAVSAGIRYEDYPSLRYFDIDYINHVRGSLSRGNTRMYDNGGNAAFGQNWAGNARLVGNGIFYLLFSIDLTNVKRDRQLAAIPEMLFIFYCLPYLFVGVTSIWKRSPRMALPILLFAFAIIGVYASAATNMGALFRWRAQALPFLIMLIVYGASTRRRGFVWATLRRLRRSTERCGRAALA